MEENKYLNEKNYQKAKKKLTILALFVLLFGLCIGGFLIYKGVAKPNLAKVDELHPTWKLSEYKIVIQEKQEKGKKK